MSRKSSEVCEEFHSKESLVIGTSVTFLHSCNPSGTTRTRNCRIFEGKLRCKGDSFDPLQLYQVIRRNSMTFVMRAVFVRLSLVPSLVRWN